MGSLPSPQCQSRFDDNASSFGFDDLVRINCRVNFYRYFYNDLYFNSRTDVVMSMLPTISSLHHCRFRTQVIP